MKTLFTIISAFLFCVSSQAQLYRLVVNGTDFYAVQSGTSSNLFMATNTIASTRYLTMGTGVLLGRGTAGSGAIEQITLGTGLSLSGTTLNGSSSGTIGTMINSGASTTSQYPKYTDNTGTNLAPDTITLASADFANQGTATTVLHGNAAGNPTWGAVALATDVSGTLQAAQVGTFTGDITTPGGSYATTLKNTGPGVSTFTSVTIDAQGRVTAGSNPTTQTTLDQVLAALGNSSIANGAFTTAMSWTNRNAGTYSTTLKYGLGQATAGGLNVTEIAKSTGGAAGQNLMTIQTINGSTANPLQILVGGTNALTIYNVNNQLLAGDAAGNPDSTYPEYSYLINNRYGTALNSGGYLEFIINAAARARVDSQGIKVTSAGTAANPAYSYTTSTSSGTYSPFTGTVGLSGGGVLGLWVTNSMVLATNFTFNGTITASNATVGVSGQVLTSGGAGYVPSWTTLPSSSVTFDAILADAASSSINNTTFTNRMRYTNATAAAQSLTLAFGLANATSLGFVSGDDANPSTGGSGNQWLNTFQNAASSTAGPFRVVVRGTNSLWSSYNTAQTYLVAGTAAYPSLTSGDGSSGVYWTSTVRMRVGAAAFADRLDFAGNGTVQLAAGSQEYIGLNDAGDSGGVMLYDSSGAAKMSAGYAGLNNRGLSYKRRHAVKTANDTLIANIAVNPGGEETGSGMLYSNNGASGSVTLTLPTEANNARDTWFEFSVETAQAFIIKPAGTDTINVAGVSSTASTGDVRSSTVGAVIRIQGTGTAGVWMACSGELAWTIN